MRFMVLVKADKNSEAGVLPDKKILTEMGKFNEEMVKAGVLLAAEGRLGSPCGARGACAGLVGQGAGRLAVGAGASRQGRYRRRRQSRLLRRLRCGAGGLGNGSFQPGHLQAARHDLPPL